MTKMPKIQKIPNLFLLVKCKDDQLLYFIMFLLISFLLLINVLVLGSLELFSLALIHTFPLKINQGSYTFMCIYSLFLIDPSLPIPITKHQKTFPLYFSHIFGQLYTLLCSLHPLPPNIYCPKGSQFFIYLCKFSLMTKHKNHPHAQVLE